MKLIPLVLILLAAGCGREEEEKRMAKLEAELRAERLKREDLERRVNPVQVPTATPAPTDPVPAPTPSPVVVNKTARVEKESVATGLPNDRIGDLFIFARGEKVAWIATAPAGKSVVINGKAQKTYVDVESTIRVTPDGNEIYYVANEGGRRSGGNTIGGTNLLVVGSVVKAQTKGKLAWPVVAPDGKVAYIATESYEDGPVLKHRDFVVVDGKEGPRQQAAYSLMFHPDGRTPVYEITEGAGTKYEDHAVVIGERIGRPFFQISSLQATPDGHVVYVGNRPGEGDILVVDETEKLLGKDVGQGFARSPDGRRLAFTVARESGTAVKVDGKVGPVYAGMLELSFSPDGKRFAYFADVTGTWRQGGMVREREGDVVILDGSESVAYGDIYVEFAWSPRGTRLGYKVKKKGEEKWRVVIGDFVSNPFESVSMPFFPEEDMARFFVRESGSLERVTVRW